MGSEQTNPPATRNGLPKPIAEMGPWDFWARPEAVGLSAEDAAALKSCTATREQLDRAHVAGQAAMNALITAQGPQHRKPS